MPKFVQYSSYVIMVVLNICESLVLYMDPMTRTEDGKMYGMGGKFNVLVDVLHLHT